MFTLALALVASSTTGGLLAETMPSHVRLLDAGDLVLGQYAAPAGQPQSLAAMRAEYAELEASKPSLGLGLGLLIPGGVSTIIGLSLAAYAVYVEVLVVGLVLLGVGIPLVVIGAILVANAVRHGREINAQMSALRYRIRNAEATGTGGGSEIPVAPDAPPPPQVLVGPQSTLLLAAF
jgi:hypothetical protein